MIKRSLFIITLALVSSISFAEWRKIGEIPGSGSAYVNTSNIKKVNSHLEVQILLNAESGSTGTEEGASWLVTTLVNCDATESRTTKVQVYSQLYASGELITEESFAATEWKGPIPGDPVSNRLYSICDNQ